MTTVSSDPGGLGHRSITALLWGTGGSVVRIGLQIGAQIVLARILGPELYGAFAVALVAVMLSSLFADVGLAYGLIQKPTVSQDDIRFVFTWQVLLGLTMTLLLWLSAPLVANLSGNPRLADVVAMLAPSCLINSASATSGALLRREMDFKTLNIAAVVSYAVGFLLFAIPMALAGAGVASLVAGFMVQAVVMGAIQYWRSRHAVTPLLWQPGAPGILSFGLTVLATNVVNWAMSSIDRAIVGSTMGLAAAGLYSTAYNLISAPLLTALSLLQSVFYSASARLQDDREQLRRGLRALFGAVTLFCAPIFGGVATSAETIFLTLYGERWVGGGDVLAPLALAMPAYLLMGLATPVLWASGATRKEFQLQVPIAIGWIAVLWVVGQTGSLLVLSWAVCLLFHVRAAVVIGATLKAIGMAPAKLARSCRAGLAVTAIVMASGGATNILLAPRLGHGPLLLLIDVMVCAAAMLIGLRMMGGAVERDVGMLLGQVADRVPGRTAHRALALMLGPARA